MTRAWDPRPSRNNRHDQGRRRALQALGSVALGAVLPRAHADSTTLACQRKARLFLPADAGYLGRLAPNGRPIELIAGPAGRLPAGVTHGSFAYRAHANGRDYVNPTLILRPGERVQARLINHLNEPTILHWHGFAVDTHNDGAGFEVIAPGEHYDYDFEVRNRGALLWYHPHPHGTTAAQVYGGLYGLVMVEDDADRALRKALDLSSGITEWTLVLQDRRPGTTYAPVPHDLVHGFLGNDLFINGTACATRDVQSRVYRLRLLNACNARTLRLAFRTRAGTSIPFLLIGSDGGLLPAPVRCEQAFLATAERLDLLLDLRDAAVGDEVLLETLAFDPMHAEVRESPPAQGAGSSSGQTDATAPPHVHDHAAMLAAEGVAGIWPEGTPRALLSLRVRVRVRYERDLPTTLASTAAIDVEGAKERPFRLGFNKGRWRINDRVYAMGETPIEVSRNTREVWLLRNYFTSMPHAMHVHGFHFEVRERETSPDQIGALAIDGKGRLATDLGRKDTVLVWPGESVRVAIDFTLPFAGPQTYVFHCHNLEHEDGGMMLGMKVT